MKVCESDSGRSMVAKNYVFIPQIRLGGGRHVVPGGVVLMSSSDVWIRGGQRCK